MPAASLPTSPPDLQAIVTSLGVFSLAVAAVVGGIYKGIKEVRKGGGETGKDAVAALSIDAMTIRSLAESNVRLADNNREILEVMRSLDHKASLLVEALGDHRSIVRSQIEEQHRLRAATVDLVELLRRSRS